MSVAISVRYSIDKALDSSPEGFITRIDASVLLGEPGGQTESINFSLVVVHLGSALSCGLDGRALYDQFEHGDLLNRVIDSRGYLKALGLWDKPINMDVGILCGLRVPEGSCSEGIATNAILESIRSFAGACGYVLMPEPSSNAAIRVAESMRMNGMFDALPGVLALALDYTNAPQPKGLLTHSHRRLDS